MRAFACVVVLAGCGGNGKSGSDAPPNGDATNGEYAAFALPGGLDRLLIIKRTPTTCYAIRLVTPGTSMPGFAIPANWGHDTSFARQPSEACNPTFSGTPTNMTNSTTHQGSISFTGATFPTQISSIVVDLTFDAAATWTPSLIAFDANDIPVN